MRHILLDVTLLPRHMVKRPGQRLDNQLTDLTLIGSVFFSNLSYNLNVDTLQFLQHHAAEFAAATQAAKVIRFTVNAHLGHTWGEITRGTPGEHLEHSLGPPRENFLLFRHNFSPISHSHKKLKYCHNIAESIFIQLRIMNL